MFALPRRLHLQQVAIVVASQADEVEVEGEAEGEVVVAAAVAAAVKGPGALEGAGRGQKVV